MITVLPRPRVFARRRQRTRDPAPLPTAPLATIPTSGWKTGERPRCWRTWRPRARPTLKPNWHPARPPCASNVRDRAHSRDEIYLTRPPAATISTISVPRPVMTGHGPQLSLPPPGQWRPLTPDPVTEVLFDSNAIADSGTFSP